MGKRKGFSLVGIEGSDILDANKLLTLGLVWQLMRRNIVNTMQNLSSSGRDISDAQILKWAQDQAAKSTTKASRVVIRSFKDPALSNAHFLLDVLNGIAPGYVDYDLVTPGNTPEERYANARLAISIARKLGALIWLVPEDINEGAFKTDSYICCLFDGPQELSIRVNKKKEKEKNRISENIRISNM